MNLEEAVAWLEAHIDYGTWAARSARTGDVDLSLDRMRRFVGLLGDPQRGLQVVHVTGTNGKGSTSRIITRLLMAEGLRVGTYSSPHLARYNERFRIDDTDIDDASLAALLTQMAAAEATLGDRLMPFEVLTAAAYRWFADEHVDVAVVEVGVLGRFDATNVADGRVAVVTNIGFDHTNGEGDWQSRLADEKAGIIKPGAHLVLGAIDDRLEPLFLAQRPGHVWRLHREIRIVEDRATDSGRELSVSTPWQHLTDLQLPLHGAHQAANCALAIGAASAFVGHGLLTDHVSRALAAVRMPARLEVVRRNPTVILDGAHNPDAARALAAALLEVPAKGRRVLIIGVLAGRDPTAMLDALDVRSFDDVIVCTPPTARARPAAELAEAAATLGATARVADDVEHAVALSLAEAAPDDQLVVTGSIYLVAAARAHLVP